MRKLYLLASCLLLAFQSGATQLSEIYAASVKAESLLPAVSSDYNTLKQSLQELEKFFRISIAYKDDWIRGKEGRIKVSAYRTPEQALIDLLKETDLSFRKAGDAFYIILPQKGDHTTAALDIAPQAAAVPASLTAFTSPLFITERQPSLSIPVAVSQDIDINGTVTDESGAPFPGVNIVVKGTSTGTSTSIDGKFSLSVPDESSILVFSFVGYITQEVTVGNRQVINVVLAPDVKNLDEVVVTALGIEKSSKSLGYAASKVDASELIVNRTPNLMNALQGKIAGVNISGLSTGPGGTSKIRIRGQTSMSGQNNPLIVVNGIPMNPINFGTNPGATADNSIGVRGGGNTSDGGDALSSFNPDDIESMTVLKGGAAAALYGSRASNGVIMITTKSKGTGKGLGVTYNLNYTNETPLDFTDYQYEYGQGENGVRPTAPNPQSGQWSFGERFQPNMTQVLFDGVTVPYEPQRDRIKQFFRNGQNTTHTISLSSGGEKGGFNLSLANMESKGITPNNSFTRKTINLGLSHALTDKFRVKSNIYYSNEYNKNPPNVGQQDNTIPVSLYNLANSMPLSLLDEKKYDANGNEFVYSRFRNRTNPYWVLAEQFQNIRRDRIFGNISLEYDLTSWLSVMGRVGQDWWNRDQDYNNFPTGHASRGPAPAGFVNGVYTQENRRFREINADFLLTAKKKFGDFTLNVNAGGNRMYRRMDLNSVQVTDFVVRGLYTVQNGRAKDPLYNFEEWEINSLYGAAEVGFKDMVYVNATLRNDWFSTLSPENRSIPYPSVTGTYVFTESFNTTPQWLNFGKLRAAYSVVGSDSDVAPYSNLLYYGINANLLANPSGVLQPIGGPNSNILPNRNLRPSTTSETEIGFELKMFNSRVGIDFAAYKKITEDQIVLAQISDGSGFTNTRINSGRSQNKGVEMLLNLVPVETADLTWEFTANASYNITEVLSLLSDTPGERITVGTHVFNGELRQVVGEEMAQLAGFGYRRDPQGQIIFGANGIPLRTQQLMNFGSALPRWVGGFNNAVSYKGVRLSFLIDFKLGGKMISGTNFNAVRHGLHKMTLPGREEGVIIGEGVNEAGQPNAVPANIQSYWEVVRTQALIEPIVYNAGFWKLRQVTIGYDFTKHIPSSWPVRGLQLNLVANNVLMLKKWVPNIDPETFGFSSDNVVGLESTGLPTTRSMGFNLNVRF